MKNEFVRDAGEGIGYVQEYIQQQKEFVKLEMVEKSSILVSRFMTGIILIFIVFMFLGFLSLAAGIFIGQLIQSYAWAFVIIASAYIVIGATVYLFRHPLITNPVITRTIKELYK